MSGDFAKRGSRKDAKQAASGALGALGAAALARDLLADMGVWPSSQAASSRKPALAQQLGLSITTSPQVGGNQRALVGMQVTFTMRLARPPRDVAVTITEWELVTPRGRWATVPRGPSTTLPITAAGPHLFRAKIRLSDGRELAIEHAFEAITPAEHASALLGATDDVPYEQFRSQQELQRALLRPPGADEQGKGATRRIVTSAANPTPVDDSDRPRQIMFSIQDNERPTSSRGDTRYHWYLRPMSRANMPESLGGHARVKTPEGLEAYDLGTGPSAQFPASHKNLYVVICQADDAQGRTLGDTRYLQSILGNSDIEKLDEFEEYLTRVDDLGGRIQGPRIPVTAVHVATRSGAATPLRLYLGRAKANSSRFVLVDMTPGLDPERSELDCDGASIAEILEEFEDDNKYPEGAISLRIPKNELGIQPMERRIQTDGESLLGRLSSAAGLASLAMAAGAMVAAPFTGGGSLVVTALLIGSATAGVTAGALSLADHLQTEELDEVGVTLDVLTIATSFLNAGLAIKAMRSGPAMLVASRGTRFLLWSNFVAEGVSGVLVTIEGAEQIAAIVTNDRLSPDEKMNALVRVVSNLILTGALLAVSYGEMGHIRGRLRRGLGEVEGKISDQNRLTLALLDEETLQSLKGATVKDADRLADMLRDDPGLVGRLAGRKDLVPALRVARGNTATDLELAFRHVRLRARGIDDTAIERLSAALREAGLEARLLPTLGDDTLARLADIRQCSASSSRSRALSGAAASRGSMTGSSLAPQRPRRISAVSSASSARRAALRLRIRALSSMLAVMPARRCIRGRAGPCSRLT